MLEALYEWEGPVLHGKGMGHALGFATANLPMPTAEEITQGVYGARVWIDGAWHPAVVNIGRHPTLPDGPSAAEVHVIGYAGDLYGRRLRVRLTHFLREERRFDSLQALRMQIQADIKETLRLLGEPR